MRIKLFLLFLFCLVFIGMVTNSCKKDKDYIQTLFSGGQWQLASVMRVHILNNATFQTDTLNTECNQTQIFLFNTDNTCSYTNFDCVTQPKAIGKWSLSSNKLILMADMICQDTLTGSSKPFGNARIMNLGQYSLVLRTGQYNTYYPAGDTVVYTDYSFVRVKAQ